MSGRDPTGERTQQRTRSAEERVLPRRSTTNLRGTVVGAALSIGAGAGAVFGLLLGGAAGLANGAGLGAGLGIVAGAVWEETHAPR